MHPLTLHPGPRECRRGIVHRVRQPRLLRRVVRAAARQDDVCVRAELALQEVEEQGVPDVVDGEGGLDAVRGELHGAGELEARVQEEGF